MSQALRFIHPYLFHVTYKFHVEKAREAGKYAIPIQNCEPLPTRFRSHQYESRGKFHTFAKPKLYNIDSAIWNPSCRSFLRLWVVFNLLL